MATIGDHEYRYENGRRYHAFDERAYYMPNDDAEVSRLDTQHNIWLLTLDNALFRAPIVEALALALDVGTGSGIWAAELARQYPSCHVLGIDLSPTKANETPPKNCAFQVYDAETEWSFADPGSYDLIHSRMLLLGMRNWRGYFKKCYDYLKPGGWVEVHKVQFPVTSADPSVPADAPFLRWSHLIAEGLAKGGMDGGAANNFPRHLKELEFQNIMEEKISWAIGPWMTDEKEKQIGELQRLNVHRGLEGMTLAILTKNLGWTRDKVNNFLADVHRDIDNFKQKYIATV